MITGTERRNAILDSIKTSAMPISGTTLARTYEVSRQVVVQDIALIRAAGHDIISTNRGYILNAPHKESRIFKVSHTDEALENELCAIVDLGGTIVNVMINHKVYGHMEAVLNISTKRKVMEFMADIRSGKSSPLKNITSNYHYHKVESDTVESLDMIEEMLRREGYLIEA